MNREQLSRARFWLITVGLGALGTIGTVYFGSGAAFAAAYIRLAIYMYGLFRMPAADPPRWVLSWSGFLASGGLRTVSKGVAPTYRFGLFIAATSAVTGLLVALASINEKLDFILLGIPYLAPLGSTLIGVGGASGATYAIWSAQRRAEDSDLPLFLFGSLLSIGFAYAFAWLIGDSAILLEGHHTNRDLGPAPSTLLTLALQVWGALIGGLYCYLETRA